MDLSPLVEKVVTGIVAEPDAVKVREYRDRGSVRYMVTVAPNDVGKVIGKEGRVIACVRQLVGAAGAKARMRVNVKVVTED